MHNSTRFNGECECCGGPDHGVMEADIAWRAQEAERAQEATAAAVARGEVVVLNGVRWAGRVTRTGRVVLCLAERVGK